MSYKYIFHLRNGKNIVMTDNSDIDVEDMVKNLSDAMKNPTICRFQTDKDIILLKASEIEGISVNSDKLLPKPKIAKSKSKIAQPKPKARPVIEENIEYDDDDAALTELMKTTESLIDDDDEQDSHYSKFDTSRLKPAIESDSEPYDLDTGGMEDDDDEMNDLSELSSTRNLRSINVTKVGNKTILSPKRRH